MPLRRTVHYSNPKSQLARSHHQLRAQNAETHLAKWLFILTTHQNAYHWKAFYTGHCMIPSMSTFGHRWQRYGCVCKSRVAAILTADLLIGGAITCLNVNRSSRAWYHSNGTLLGCPVIPSLATFHQGNTKVAILKWRITTLASYHGKCPQWRPTNGFSWNSRFLPPF